MGRLSLLSESTTTPTGWTRRAWRASNIACGKARQHSCRHWSAAPVNAFTLWQPENVKITRGEDNIGTFDKTPQSYRKWCTICGGHIFKEHPELGLTDVYAAVIPDVPFIPGLHVNYSETKLPIRDGLLKLKDFPHGFGGSGIEVVE
jgi:hypothetical protein